MIPNEKCVCIKCKHCESNGFNLFCKAFEDGVPDVILSGENKHLKPLQGQNNSTVFEPKKD